MPNKPFLILGLYLLFLVVPFSSQAQISDIPQSFQFEQSLYQNIESTQVKYLQIVLAELGSDIYPEAITSGYFGYLTQKAVTNFQLKYNIISSASHPATGYVGPQTRAKLNEVLNNLRKPTETKIEASKESEKQTTTPIESQTIPVNQTIKGSLTVVENIKASRLYQENNNLIINTLGSGNLMLTAATGLHLYGNQIVIDSTSLLNPLVYIESPLRIEGALTQTGGNVTLGDVSVSTLNVSTLTASTLTVSGATTLTTLTVGTINSTGDLDVSGDLNASTGRGATFVVAASDSATTSKAQADYLCDGTADDVEIQAAIDALPTDGGKVLLTEGTFNITTTVLTRRGYLTIEGHGKGVTIISFSGAPYAFNLGLTDTVAQTGTRIYDVTVRDMSFIGDGADNENHLLFLEGIQRLEVSGCSFYQSGDEALLLRFVDDFTIYNNIFEDVSVVDAGGALFFERASKRGSITNNHFLDSTSKTYISIRAIQDSESYEDINIIGNTFDTTQNGVDIAASTNAGAIITRISVIGNTFKNLTSGVYVEAYDPATVLGVNVVGNTFSSCTHGVRITTQTTNTTVIGNYFASCTSNVTNAGTNTIVRNNGGYVTENSGTAILAAGNNSTTTDHGLAGTPTNVIVTATSTDIGAIAVTSKTSTQFTITSSTTTTEDVGIYWEAKYEP